MKNFKKSLLFEKRCIEWDISFTLKIKNKIVDAGFDPEKITEKIVTSDFSRAGAIVKEAANGGYSSIAVGRRGISKVEEFLMGRVSNKVIHGDRHHTVWVV